MRHTRIALGFTLVALGALAACGGGGPGTSEITSVMSDFSFAPADSTVGAGSAVTLELENNGSVEHNWVLMNFGYEASAPFDDNDQAQVFTETKIAPGESGTHSFTAPSEAGTYQVVCSIPGHLEAGMVAQLTVNP